MSISGCILAKNEAQLLPDCIRSLRAIADEIIVVDNGSSDNSREIAKDMGCIVIDGADREFDLARNLYVDRATCDWIFVLDADERLDQASAGVALETSSSADSEVVQFALPVYHYLGLGKFVETQFAGRFFRNHPKIRYNEVPSHATISMSARKVGKKADLHYPIHHIDALYKKRMGIKRQGRKAHMLKTIEASPNIENLSTQYLFLGAEYAVDGDYETALSYLQKAPLIDGVSTNTAHLYMAHIFRLLGEREKALHYAEGLLNRGALIDRAYCILTQVAVDEGRLFDAQAYCREALEKKPMAISLLLNYASLIIKSDPKAAIEYMEKAIKINPYLLNPDIYREGDSRSLYGFQSPLLEVYEGLWCFYSQKDK